MKHYQDTITGQIYAFENSDNVEKLMQTNRNIPKTLIDKVKKKPSDNHIWYNEDWIDKKDTPINYKEPISEVPIYNPAWISFLFKEGTILFNLKNKFEITLQQINSNSYIGKELSKIITTLPNNDKSTTLEWQLKFRRIYFILYAAVAECNISIFSSNSTGDNPFK